MTSLWGLSLLFNFLHYISVNNEKDILNLVLRAGFEPATIRRKNPHFFYQLN
jgi:hypothetical protein